jgi:serine protease Do
MKRYFLTSLVAAGMSLAALPAFAQDYKTEKDGKDKEVQTITITRVGNTDEKCVIEVKGDKITVNGKEAGKDNNVKVRVNSHTRPDANFYSKIAQARTNNDTWVYNGNNDAISLFSEDSNRAMLGVVTDMNDKGAQITSVNKESAAEKAGLKKGDIITNIGGKKIEDAEDVSNAVLAHKPGDKVPLTILRDGKEQKLTAELGRWKGIQFNKLIPSRIQADMDVDITSPMPFSQGFRTLVDSRPRLGLSIQDTEDGKGVKVTEVDEDGTGAKAGVKTDDIITHVNEIETNSADEIAKIVRDSKDKPSVKFRVIRNGKTENLEVRIPRKLKTAEL